jgi:hypothetical protein
MQHASAIFTSPRLCKLHEIQAHNYRPMYGSWGCSNIRDKIFALAVQTVDRKYVNNLSSDEKIEANKHEWCLKEIVCSFRTQ